jgi:uncharacterized coiled-coil DUF342 family protein
MAETNQDSDQEDHEEDTKQEVYLNCFTIHNHKNHLNTLHQEIEEQLRQSQTIHSDIPEVLKILTEIKTEITLIYQVLDIVNVISYPTDCLENVFKEVLSDLGTVISAIEKSHTQLDLESFDKIVSVKYPPEKVIEILSNVHPELVQLFSNSKKFIILWALTEYMKNCDESHST